MVPTSLFAAFAASAMTFGLGGPATASVAIDLSPADTFVLSTEWLVKRPHTLTSPVLIPIGSKATSRAALPQLLSTDQLAS